jgi:hypothetical protein
MFGWKLLLEPLSFVWVYEGIRDSLIPKIFLVIKNVGIDLDPDTATAWIWICILQNVWIRGSNALI